MYNQIYFSLWRAFNEPSRYWYCCFSFGSMAFGGAASVFQEKNRPIIDVCCGLDVDFFKNSRV